LPEAFVDIGLTKDRFPIPYTPPTAAGNELLASGARSQEGRIQSVIINDSAGIPPVGDFICLPAFIGTNGQLREAKQLNSQAFFDRK
jgi:hypothetical protein